MDYSFLILLASILISRFVLLNAFNKLTEEEKVKVLSGSVIRLSQITLVTTIIMVAVFYYMIMQYKSMYQTISLVFFFAILAQRMVAYAITRKNMIENGIPSRYMKMHFLSWAITTVGVVLFVFLLVKNYF